MVAMRASCIMRLPRQFFFRIRLNYIMNALNGFALVLVPLPRQKPPYIPYFQRKYWCKNAVYRITPSWMGWALWGWLCDNVAHAIMRVRHATHTHTYRSYIMHEQWHILRPCVYVLSLQFTFSRDHTCERNTHTRDNRPSLISKWTHETQCHKMTPNTSCYFNVFHCFFLTSFVILFAFSSIELVVSDL